MKILVLIVASIVLFGCAARTISSDTSNPQKTQATVLKCSNGLANCYSKANEICGSRGFVELDRTQDGRLHAAGRLDEQGEDRHIYREDLRFDDEYRTLAFRCK